MNLITCRETIEFLADYLDRALPPAQRDEFEYHLALCAPCVHYLNGYREAMRLGKSVFTEPESPIPPDVPEDLVKAILASRRAGS
jgi:anti-sigma factor RsiW